MASGSEVRAGGAFVEFFTKGDGAVQATLKSLEGAMKSMGKGVTLAGAALSGIGASITAPFLYGLSVASEWAAGLVGASRRTGIGFQELQTLSMALRLDLDEMASATRKMNSFLDEAAHGSDGANRQLEELNLTIEELMQLSEANRVRRLADALSQVSDAGRRGAAQTHIFGRNAMAMNISGGAAGLRDREGQASRFSMSDADVALMKEYNLAQKELGMAGKALWASIGAAAAGPMMEFFRIVTNLILTAKGWADENRPLLETIFRIADAMVTVGAILAGTGAAIMAGSFVFSLMGTAISFAGTMAWFASGAFLVVKIATWLWNVAVMALNVNVAIGHLMTWAWIALLAALAIAIYAVQAALGLGVLAVIGFAVYMLWTRGVIQAAWDIIVDIFEKSIDWICQTFDDLIEAASKAWGEVKNVFSSAWEWISGLFGGGGEKSVLAKFFDDWLAGAILTIDSITSWFGRLFDTASSVGSSIGGAFTQSFSVISTMFSGLVGTATTAWRGIMDAFAIGDWNVLWDILKAAAELGWAHVRQAGEGIWTAITDAATDVWNTAKDFVIDTFENVWTVIKTGFVVAWNFIKEKFFDVLIAIVSRWDSAQEAMAAAADALNPLMGEDEARRAFNQRQAAAGQRMTGLRDARNEARDEQTNAPGRIRAEAAAAEAARQAERIDRDADEADARQRRDQAAGEGNAEEIERLDAELSRLAHWAEEERAMQEARRGGAMEDAREGTDQTITQARNQGTFSAAAASGFAGGSAMDRLQRVNEDQRTLMQQLVDLARENGQANPAMG